ncbi:uncharacterized protein K489DRAFT_48323 [Dissoconium aciculare CBS 342.82]|uniref:Uncharacterized protein n=1 Tax=Dissoconium aciculare CBS 342.82 TaxID=1314786 RepID=A0A6J3LWY6_9PEZI|nr:uncharacterized protein K489DRAFT_48323 [Dissoconium aciculare CBS 342.82]KAF1820168.1 hypothetical protein K489DRAFT_48323 [Dissoconium aciculare CBS 342.82]
MGHLADLPHTGPCPQQEDGEEIDGISPRTTLDLWPQERDSYQPTNPPVYEDLVVYYQGDDDTRGRTRVRPRSRYHFVISTTPSRSRSARGPRGDSPFDRTFSPMNRCEDTEVHPTFMRDPPYPPRIAANKAASRSILDIPQNAKVTWKNTIGAVREKIQKVRGSRFRLIKSDQFEHKFGLPPSPTPSKTSSLTKWKTQSKNLLTVATPKLFRTSKTKDTPLPFAQVRRRPPSPPPFVFNFPQYSSVNHTDNSRECYEDHRSPSATSSKEPTFIFSNSGSISNSEGPFTPESATSPAPGDHSHSRTYHYRDQSLQIALRQSISSDTHFKETPQLGFPTDDDGPTDFYDARGEYPYQPAKHHPHPLAEPMYWDPSETSLTALPRLPERLQQGLSSQYKEIVLGGHGFGNGHNQRDDRYHHRSSSPTSDDDDVQYPFATTGRKGLRHKERQRRREMALPVTTSHLEGLEMTPALASRRQYDDDDDDDDDDSDERDDEQDLGSWSWNRVRSCERSPEFMARVSHMRHPSVASSEYSMGRF